MSDKDPLFQIICKGIRENDIGADKKIQEIRNILNNHEVKQMEIIKESLFG